MSFEQYKKEVEDSINKLKGMEAYKDRPLGQRVLGVLQNIKKQIDSLPSQYSKKKESMYASMRNMTNTMLQKYAPDDIARYELGLRRTLDDFNKYLKQSSEAKSSLEKQMTPNPDMQAAQADINMFNSLAQSYEEVRKPFDNHELTIGEQEYKTMKNEYNRLLNLSAKAQSQQNFQLSEAFVTSADKQITGYVNRYYGEQLPKVAEFARHRLAYLIVIKSQTYINGLKQGKPDVSLKTEITRYKATYEKYKTKSIDNDQALATLLQKKLISAGVGVFLPPDPVYDLGIDISGARFKEGYMEGIKSGFSYLLSVLTLVPQMSYNLGYTQNMRESFTKTVGENAALKSMVDLHGGISEIGDVLGSIWAINTGDSAQLSQFMQEFQAKPTVQTIDLLLRLRPSDVARIMAKITPEQWGKAGGQLTISMATAIVSSLAMSKALVHAPKSVQELFKTRRTALEEKVRQYMKDRFDLHFGRNRMQVPNRPNMVDTRQTPHNQQTYQKQLVPDKSTRQTSGNAPETKTPKPPAEEPPRLPTHLEARARVATKELDALIKWFETNASNDNVLKSVLLDLKETKTAQLLTQEALEDMEDSIRHARKFMESEQEIASQQQHKKQERASQQAKAEELLVAAGGKEEFLFFRENFKIFQEPYNIADPSSRPLRTRLYLTAKDTFNMQGIVKRLEESMGNELKMEPKDIGNLIKAFNNLFRSSTRHVEHLMKLNDVVKHHGSDDIVAAFKQLVEQPQLPYQGVQLNLIERSLSAKTLVRTEIEKMAKALEKYGRDADKESIRTIFGGSVADNINKLDRNALETPYAQVAEMFKRNIDRMPTRPFDVEPKHAQPVLEDIPEEKLVVTPAIKLKEAEKAFIREGFENLRNKVVEVPAQGEVVKIHMKDIVEEDINGVLEGVDLADFARLIEVRYKGSVENFVNRYKEDLPNYIRYHLEEAFKKIGTSPSIPDFVSQIRDKNYNIINRIIDRFDASEQILMISPEGQSQRFYMIPNNPDNRLPSPDFLGEGGFGTVYTARSYSETGAQEIAVKMANLEGVPDEFHMSILESLHQERVILQNFSQMPEGKRYMVGFEGTSDNEKYLGLTKMRTTLNSLYMENYFDIDNLGDKEALALLKQVNEQTIDGYFDHLEAALQFLHKQGFAHADIKPGNIGISAEDGLPRLMDMGGAVHQKELNPGRSIPFTDGYGFERAVTEAKETGDILKLQAMDRYALAKSFRKIIQTGLYLQARFPDAPRYSQQFLDKINIKAREWLSKFEGYEMYPHEPYKDLASQPAIKSYNKNPQIPSGGYDYSLGDFPALEDIMANRNRGF